MIKIHSFETLGTNEGPGIRSVVFTQGCNLRCAYCHNPDTQKINSGTEKSDEEIIDFIMKSKSYYGKKGGVTFSGGEPLLQAKELLPLFAKLKNLKINIALDTSGSIFNNDVEKLLKNVDLVLLDIKEIDNKSHIKLTESSNITILKFAKYLEEKQIPFWIRFVYCPEYSDNKEHIKQMGEHFKNYKMLERVEILPYHTLGKYKYDELGIENKAKDIIPPTPEKVNEIKNILEKYFEAVLIR